jgi:hypothetical protein
MLVEAAGAQPEVAAALAGDDGWEAFVAGGLSERNALEDISRWVCGRPSADAGGMESDGDDFQVCLLAGCWVLGAGCWVLGAGCLVAAGCCPSAGLWW